MNWNDIKSYLPKGWEQKCVELRALMRSRTIKNPEELLEVIFTYLTIGESLNQTASIMAAKNMKMSKVALFERVQKSGEWLRWILQEILKSYNIILEKPQWLGDKKVVLVDGSCVSLRGSSEADYRLHMAFDLFNFCYDSLEITSVKEGEKLEKFKSENGSILIGDRGYGNINGIEYAKKQNAEFILRYRTKAFNLYEKDGKKVSLTDLAQSLRAWECKSIECFYKHDGKLKPIKVCIMKKDEKAIAESERKIKKTNDRRQRKPAKESTIEFNKYIVLCTNLEYNVENIFELYRCRWQIELVFKELKSTLSFGEIPSSNEESIKAWFYGKLLIAALSLLIMNESLFPPKN